MGRHSGSDSSPSTRSKKSSYRNRSSSRSSSGSRYSSSRSSRKNKKYKKSRRSRSREKSSKRESSRDRNRRRYKERRRRGGGRRRSSSLSSKSSASSGTSASNLLAKLNKAAVQAMAERVSNTGKDTDNSIESQLVREKTIRDINSSGFIQKPFASSSGGNSGANLQAATIAAITATASAQPIVLQPPLPPHVQDSLLHPNMLMEIQEDKLNRWVRKLYQIRHRSINGEPLNLA